MARRDHHAASRTLVVHRVGERWGGCVIVREFYRNTGSGNGFGGHFGEAARAEPRVIGNQHTAVSIFILAHVGGNGGSHASHIRKSKIVGDQASPTISAELN